MNIPASVLPALWLWLAHGLFGALLALALWRAPWARLAEGNTVHRYFGLSVVLMALWNLKAGVLPGLNFHLLGMSLLTLVFGWRLAIVAGSAVLLSATVYGKSGWESYSINALTMVVVPVLVTWGVLRGAERWLLRHLFVYIFVCGFFGAALAMAATGVATATVFASSGVYPLDQLLEHYLPYYLLLVFPEGILTGTFVALLAVYRPEWIWTYDEDTYLKR